MAVHDANWVVAMDLPDPIDNCDETEAPSKAFGKTQRSGWLRLLLVPIVLGALAYVVQTSPPRAKVASPSAHAQRHASEEETMLHGSFVWDETEHDDMDIEDEDEDECFDEDENCAAWAATGECDANAAWMHLRCPHACSLCDTAE
ncbi:hypothetical protein KFE25_002696 [Diacronema lutheri]|uniref:ShKT domain-containing protein n=1 Tax=Diacronema lutheri TaxID=2081491 RepID=A0A8J5XLI5_DIALT|nr:hypothetical protein KFE25_002696 [Diacronema lutheri]